MHFIVILSLLVITAIASVNCRPVPNYLSFHLETCCCQVNDYAPIPKTLTLNEDAAYAIHIHSIYLDSQRNEDLFCFFKVDVPTDDKSPKYGLSHHSIRSKNSTGDCPTLYSFSGNSPSSPSQACNSTTRYITPGSFPSDGGIGYKFTIKNATKFDFRSAFSLTKIAILNKDKLICDFRNKPDDEDFICNKDTKVCTVVGNTCNGFADCPIADGQADSKALDENAATCPPAIDRAEKSIEASNPIIAPWKNIKKTNLGIVHHVGGPSVVSEETLHHFDDDEKEFQDKKSIIKQIKVDEVQQDFATVTNRISVWTLWITFAITALVFLLRLFGIRVWYKHVMTCLKFWDYFSHANACISAVVAIDEPGHLQGYGMALMEYLFGRELHRAQKKDQPMVKTVSAKLANAAIEFDKKKKAEHEAKLKTLRDGSPTGD